MIQGQKTHCISDYILVWWRDKNTPQAGFADFGRGRCTELESGSCPPGIVEEFEIFKMAAVTGDINSPFLYFLAKFLIHQTQGFEVREINFNKINMYLKNF